MTASALLLGGLVLAGSDRGCRLVQFPDGGRALVCRARTEDEIALSLLGPQPSEEEERERALAEEAALLLEESRGEREMSDRDWRRLHWLVGMGYLDVDPDRDAEADFDDHDIDKDGLPSAEHRSPSWPLGMAIIPASQAVPGMHGFTGDEC